MGAENGDGHTAWGCLALEAPLVCGTIGEWLNIQSIGIFCPKVFSRDETHDVLGIITQMNDGKLVEGASGHCDGVTS